MEREIRNRYPDIPGLEELFPMENFLPFFSKDGTKLHTYKYPAKSLKCVLIVFHGLHGNANDYALTSKYFSEIGCEVVAFDQRGHGKSEGPRGLIPSFAVLLEDSCKFFTEISEIYKGLPIFLQGGSMGGCLCLFLSLIFSAEIRGLILMSPAIKTQNRFERLGRCIVNCLSSCCPSMLLVRPNFSEVFTNQQIINYVLENPFIYTDRVRTGSINSVLQGMRQVRGIIHKITNSFVVIHGTGDNIVDPEWSQHLYVTAASQDKHIWMYPGLPHALVFTPEIYEMAERLQVWISERI